MTANNKNGVALLRLYSNTYIRIRSAIVLFCATAVLIGMSACGSSSLEEDNGRPPVLAAAQDEIPGIAQKLRFGYESEQAMLDSMKLVAQNSKYELYYDSATLAIAVRVKASGKVFFSNVYNAAEDSHYSGEIKKGMDSQVVVTYLNEKNVKMNLWSSADCVEYGQYAIKENRDGLTIRMSIGREQKQLIIPTVLKETRFEELCGRMDDRGQRRMRYFYIEYNLDDLDVAGDEEERKKLIEKFPLIVEGSVFELKSDITEREKTELEGYLKAIGYTQADLDEDNKVMKSELEEVIFPNFQLSLTYTLTEEGLTVTIPNKSIAFDRKHYSLLSIKLLEYFGADAPIEGGQGYLFIPDGSGAIININDQDPRRRTLISGIVYRNNAGLTQVVGAQQGEDYYLPVFGMVRNNQSAFFSIIESGDEVSEITARLGEPTSSYFGVYNTFMYSLLDYFEFNTPVESGGSMRRVFIPEKNYYKKDYTIRYTFFDGENAHYSTMAAYYKKYLLNRGLNDNRQAPIRLQLETVGSALYMNETMGINYLTEAPFTRYTDNIDMISFLKQKGVKDISLQLSGWRKDGLDAGVSNNAKLSSTLGGKSGFKKLLQYTEDNDVDVRAGADMLFVANDRSFDGFVPSRDAGRQLDKNYAGVRKWEASLSNYGKLSYMISPLLYSKYWNQYISGCNKLGLNTLLFENVGKYLNSDFNTTTKASNRGQTVDVIKELLKNISNNNKLVFDGANAYVLPFATAVTDIPLSSSNYIGESYSVPFLHMVLSGDVAYSSRTMNMSGNYSEMLLKCVEYGASPRFTVAWDNVELIKKTEHTHLYAIDFEKQKQKIIDAYAFIKTALRDVDGSYITGHSRVAEDVYCTQYANGKKIYVNYGDTAYSTDDIQVGARGYAVQ